MLLLLHQHQLEHQFTKPLPKEKTLGMSLQKENVLAILQTSYVMLCYVFQFQSTLVQFFLLLIAQTICFTLFHSNITLQIF